MAGAMRGWNFSKPSIRIVSMKYQLGKELTMLQ